MDQGAVCVERGSQDTSNGAGPKQGAVHAFSVDICEACGTPLVGGGRGMPKRFCNDACRGRFHSEARRVGGKVLRRRLARLGKVRAPRAKRAVLRLPLSQYGDLRGFIATSAAWQ
jgi:hypothetical protein